MLRRPARHLPHISELGGPSHGGAGNMDALSTLTLAERFERRMAGSQRGGGRMAKLRRFYRRAAADGLVTLPSGFGRSIRLGVSA
jgi:hypothetical protein